MRELRMGRDTFRELPVHLALIGLAVFSLGPMVILSFNAIKSDAEIGMNGLGPPQEVHWDNFLRAWDIGHYSTTVPNSLFLAVGAALGVMVISSLAAYSLARLKPVGSGPLSAYLLVIMCIPKVLCIAPLFFLWSGLGLIDNRLGVIIIYWGLWAPFATLLLRSYFQAIPSDLEDAAKIDGASEWGVFRNVIVPLAWPGVLTAGLIISLWAWNEFLFAATFLQSADVKPISTSLYAFISRFDRDWGMTSAAAVMMILPPLLFFSFFSSSVGSLRD